MSPPISTVLITLNAERLLGRVLESVAWSDEILVVDCGSTDKTTQIAAEHGARVIYRKFDGFGTQKRFAVAQAKNDWVLVIDGDEVMTPELRDELAREMGRTEQTGHRGFTIPISLVFLGRVMRGAEHKMPHLRLFDRRHGNYTEARVHEDVKLDGTVGHLTHDLLHDSYGSIDEYLDKLNRYTTAGALDLRDRGKTAGAAQIALRFPLTFFKEYFLKGNIANGYPGFVWSLFSAMYPVVKYAKLRELARAPR